MQGRKLRFPLTTDMLGLFLSITHERGESLSIWELIGYTRRLIRGRRAELLLVCLPPIAAGLLFRLGEAAFFSMLLYFGAMRPAELFSGSFAGQLVLAAVLTLLRWGVTAPLICAAAVKLRSAVTDGAEDVTVSEMLLRGSFIIRSITAYAAGRLLCFAALVPTALLGAYAYTLVADGGVGSELFAAWNAAALAVLSAILWLGTRLSVTAVPFLLAEYPERGGLSCVLMSLSFMRGRKRFLLGLAAVYLLPLATVVGIPVFLPEAAAAFATGISIFIKEDEYARSAVRRVRRTG